MLKNCACGNPLLVYLWVDVFPSPLLMSSTLTVQEARAQLDSHTRELINWHFSPETGCPYWLDWAKNSGWDPREKVQCFDDIMHFDNFEKLHLTKLKKMLDDSRTKNPSMILRPSISP